MHQLSQNKSNRNVADLLFSLVLFIITFSVLILDESNINLSDTQWATHIYASLMDQGDTNLTEFKEEIERRDYYATRIYQDQIVSFFPVGTPILATPVLLVLEQFQPELRSESLYDHLLNHRPESPVNARLHLQSASVFVALTAVVLYFLFRHYLDRPRALFFAVLFVFGTSAYSLASRALWQHGPSMLMLALTAVVLVRAELGKKGVWLAGFTLAWAFVIRPSNSFPILVISIYILLKHRKQFWLYLLASSPVALWFFAYNLSTFDALFHPYYLANRLAFSSTFWVALVGNLLSPARGLFVFSPFLLSVPLLVLKGWRHQSFKPLDWALILIIGLHWISISLFPHWYGGDSFGPRFFSDMLPFLFVLLIRFLPEGRNGQKQLSLTQPASLVFILLALFSLVIHHVGATNKATWAWNYQPLSVDLEPARLWSWQNSQLLSAFADSKTALAITDVNREHQNLFDVQLSNKTGDVQYWEFIPPLNIGIMVPQFASLKRRFDHNGVMVAQLAKPIQPYDISPIQFKFDENIDSQSKLIQINVYKDGFDGELVETKYIPLSSFSIGDANRAILPDEANFPALEPFYGAGWYDLETFGDFSWRWSKTPALLYFHSAENRSVNLTLNFGEMFDPNAQDGKGTTGTLQLTLNDGSPIELPIQTNKPVTIPLEAQGGVNQLRFELASGNFSPAAFDAGSGDPRELSFIINSIVIE